MIGEEPQYSRLAARLLANHIDEVRGQGIDSFSQSIARGHAEGLIGDETARFVHTNARTLDDATATTDFEYFGLRTVYDRYLLRHPRSRLVVETPRYWLLRVACGLSHTPQEAIGFYRLMAQLRYLPSSPTLFNSGTRRTQMSSCFLVDSPKDQLDSIYDRYAQVAKLSKFAGGIGISWSRIRSRGALIRGTNGTSNGIVPWLRTLDASVAAVNQGGRRKGAACIYLEPWHPDIEEFLELRDNTGEEPRRTIRHRVPESRSRAAVHETGQGPRPLRPHDAHARTDQQRLDDVQGPQQRVVQPERHRAPLQPLHRDHRGHQRHRDRRVQPRVGEPRRARHQDKTIDWTALRATVRTATVFLDRVIDINYYPSAEAARSNPRWRPVGLGVMGLQDVFFALRLPFDSAEATALSTRIAEEIYLTALETSAELARAHGPHPAFAQTRTARGRLQPDSGASRPTVTGGQRSGPP